MYHCVFLGAEAFRGRGYNTSSDCVKYPDTNKRLVFKEKEKFVPVGTNFSGNPHIIYTQNFTISRV